MKSKIQFDLGIDDKPSIVMQIIQSEDVRDKIASRMADSLMLIGEYKYQGLAYVEQTTTGGTFDGYEFKPLLNELTNMPDSFLDYVFNKFKNEIEYRKLHPGLVR